MKKKGELVNGAAAHFTYKVTYHVRNGDVRSWEITM